MGSNTHTGAGLKLLLTAEETGEAIGQSLSQVRAMIAARELPSIRLGRSVRVPLDELREWLEAKKREQRAAS